MERPKRKISIDLTPSKEASESVPVIEEGVSRPLSSDDVEKWKARFASAPEAEREEQEPLETPQEPSQPLREQHQFWLVRRWQNMDERQQRKIKIIAFSIFIVALFEIALQ